MRYVLALIPILAVLLLMVWRRWGAQRAGPAGWMVGLAVAVAGFGLTWDVFWVSQVKGVLLSVFVLAVMWPALFLYHWNDQDGGIQALAIWLGRAIPNRGMCCLLMAWALGGLLEGLAGFGLPIAVVAPMLTALGVRPLQAVAAVAVGHSWAVTFGDMGIVLQTLIAVTGLESAPLIGPAALLLGIACLLCGLVVAAILGELKQWPKVLLLSLVIGGTQYGLAVVGLVPLSAFGAGLAGVLAYMGCSRLLASIRQHPGQSPALSSPPPSSAAFQLRPALMTAGTYGLLTLLMAVLTMSAPLRAWSQSTTWKAQFPAVKSKAGFATPAGPGQTFRPLAHPGTLIFTVAVLSIACASWRSEPILPLARKAGAATWRSASAATVGVLAMVGLSSLMDHCGMSYLLAQGLSILLGGAYPVVSPWVGILGAFATGSNNSSNVLFGPMQKNVAGLLNLNPHLLVAAQTAGGSLGSMLAPVKLLLGCSTVNQVGQEGHVLRRTVPYGLGIGLILGILTYILCRITAHE